MADAGDAPPPFPPVTPLHRTEPERIDLAAVAKDPRFVDNDRTSCFYPDCQRNHYQ
jgi:hypothetical protein